MQYANPMTVLLVLAVLVNVRIANVEVADLQRSTIDQGATGESVGMDRSRTTARATLTAFEAALRVSGSNKPLVYSFELSVVGVPREAAIDILARLTKPLTCSAKLQDEHMILRCIEKSHAEIDEWREWLQLGGNASPDMLRRRWGQMQSDPVFLLRGAPQSLLLTTDDYSAWVNEYDLEGVTRVLNFADATARQRGATVVVELGPPIALRSRLGSDER